LPDSLFVLRSILPVEGKNLIDVQDIKKKKPERAFDLKTEPQITIGIRIQEPTPIQN